MCRRGHAKRRAGQVKQLGRWCCMFCFWWWWWCVCVCVGGGGGGGSGFKTCQSSGVKKGPLACLPVRRELGADLECCCCDRLFHPLCLHYPAVSAAELPGGTWACPCCGEEQQVCV